MTLVLHLVYYSATETKVANGEEMWKIQRYVSAICLRLNKKYQKIKKKTTKNKSKKYTF